MCTTKGLKFCEHCRISHMYCDRFDSCLDRNRSWCPPVPHHRNRSGCCHHHSVHEKVCVQKISFQTKSYAQLSNCSCADFIQHCMQLPPSRANDILNQFYREVQNAIANAPRPPVDGEENDGYAALDRNLHTTLNTDTASEAQDTRTSEGYLQPVSTPHSEGDRERSSHASSLSYDEPYQFGSARRSEPVYEEIDE